MSIWKRLAAAAIISLLGLGFAGCSSGTSSSCTSRSCTLTVRTKSSTTVKVFKTQMKFANITDRSVDVSQAGATRTIREGESARVGSYLVKVTDAKPGQAKVTVTR